MNGELAVAIARARTERRLPAPEARRLLRERAGLTQTDVARAVGVDRATVARWENGSRRPRGAIARAYLEVLDQLATESLNEEH